MKALLIIAVVALVFVFTPAYGQLLSDATGLVNRLDVTVGGQMFEVKTVSNFDVYDYEFDEDEKRLTIFISSGLEDNLGDLIIPQTLLGGNMTFFLNGEEYFPNVSVTDRVAFATLNFTGSGENRLDVVGTNYFFGLTEKSPDIQDVSSPVSKPMKITDDLTLWTVVVVVVIGIIIYLAIKVKKGN